VNVPNQFPKLNHATSRLAIVGEAPGNEEELVGAPFVGASGRLLRSVLSQCGVAFDQCFVGNVCQIRPPGNNISEFAWDSNEIQSGILQLRDDLSTYRPNAILALGAAALRVFTPSIGTTKKGEFVLPIGNYRGSILLDEHTSDSPQQFKVVASYHPAYILRCISDIPLFKFDVARAAAQSRFPELRRTPRNINTRPTIGQVTDFLNDLLLTKKKAAFDIEGWADNVGVTMLSIASSPTTCIVIPFFLDGRHYWSDHDECLVWSLLSAWLADAGCPKGCQNVTYELFVLAWNHKCRIAGVCDDTMFKHWELFPELEKSLGVQTSIYTEEPYYKHEGDSKDADVKLLYNGKDSCCTIECDIAQEPLLRKTARSYEHYQFNCSLIPAINYMALRGCAFDRAAANAELDATNSAALVLQTEIEASLGRDFNAKSTPDKQWLLYDHLGYTPYARYGRSTKEEILLRFYAKARSPILKKVISLIALRTRKSDIGKFDTDADGRIRSNYNLVGTNTGRLNSSSSNARFAYFTKTGILKWDNSGTNLQNVTKDLRVCFTPDSSDFAFWQCDLSGADAWTVAADLAALGHTTMLEDMLYGIKPAKVLFLMLEEHKAGRNPASVNQASRADLKVRTKAINVDLKENSDQYLCMKRVQHGSNYGMEPEKLSATIFKDSDGTIDLSIKDASLYQYLYKLRYNPQAREDWVRRELRDKGYLQAASGTRRQFFGLRSRSAPDDATVREALAFEPQANTTYVCNRALHNLWYDPENRTPGDTLFIDPLLLIHDAIAGQLPRAAGDWCIAKLRDYFNISIRIHGMDIRIPFEGGYGANWKACKEVEFS
jgi:uracil-DNA glycosylase family 4